MLLSMYLQNCFQFIARTFTTDYRWKAFRKYKPRALTKQGVNISAPLVIFYEEGGKHEKMGVKNLFGDRGGENKMLFDNIKYMQ